MLYFKKVLLHTLRDTREGKAFIIHRSFQSYLGEKSDIVEIRLYVRTVKLGGRV